MKNQYSTLFSFLLNIQIVISMSTEKSCKTFKEHKDAYKNVSDNEYSRIIGGEEVKKIEKYPYHAQYGWNCGAAIIHKRWAITAAHCGKYASILAGSVYVNDGRQFLIYRHHIHPNWSMKDKEHPFDYDFQLLEMGEDIRLGKRIRPVKIGYAEDLYVGKRITVTGWGSKTEEGPLVDTLRVIQVPIISKQICQRLDYPHFRNQLTPRMFCAGFEKGGKDACQGDSGGPAVANRKLYGLVSFGYRCALPNVYGVYSNVVRVRSWIEDTATFKV